MEKIKIQIHGLTHSGDGVGRHCGMAVFVSGAAPGETVLAELTEQKKNYARAHLLEVIIPSPARIEPRCSFFPACGGCRLLHVNYVEQLRLKTGLVRDSLARIAGLSTVDVRETLGMDDPWHYRNKARFQVANSRGRLALGYYEEGSHTLAALFGAGENHKPGCLLVDRGLIEVALTVEDLLNKYAPAGVRERQDGFFRHVVLRKAVYTGQVMVVLVTGGGDWPRQEALAGELLAARPEIASLVRSIKNGPSGPAPGMENRLMAGRPYIVDRCGQLDLMISPSSFYQVNPAQTLVLYRKALEYAGLEPPGCCTVVDAYSGIGSIALFMAGQAKKVYGLEVSPETVRDARRNASLNSLDNVEFKAGEAEKLLPAMAARGLRPDVAVLDPPRRGCRPEVLQAVADMEPERVVYVSCDPATLARDLALLAGKGYRVDEVQPVDMFPWTHHVETVVLMSRVDR